MNFMNKAKCEWNVKQEISFLMNYYHKIYFFVNYDLKYRESLFLNETQFSTFIFCCSSIRVADKKIYAISSNQKRNNQPEFKWHDFYLKMYFHGGSWIH